MSFLLRTLSLSYVRRHLAKTLLTLLGVIVGVATFTAIRAARTTLVGGLERTVDRMAGKAQLQISSDAGVPEEILETVRALPSVRATSPVIEQIVTPEDGRLGSLLILGVDLLGDREMRDYGFEGEDADLDDPLLFLAQADSLAVSNDFARRAGLQKDSPFVFQAPAGPLHATVRGLLEPKGFAEAFGGNVAVMDVYAAQSTFGRGRRFDRIELRLADGVTIAAGQHDVAAAVGPGYRVEAPDRRGAQMEKLISNFVVGFTMSSVFALGIGTFLIFNAFQVAVGRRRRDIGTLRALGATPSQVRALFLLEAFAIGLVGGILGLAAGALLARSSLDLMGEAVRKIYGFQDPAPPHVGWVTGVQSVLLGVLASLAGAFRPAAAAARVRPTEALAKGVHAARIGPFPARRLAAGLTLLAVTVVINILRPVGGPALFFLVAFLGLGSLMLTTGPLARLLVRVLTPVVARLSPVAGQLAADSLAGSPRRTSGTVVVMTLSLAFVLGMGGYMESTKATLTRWMDDILTSDLYVRASVNFTRPDFRFPPEIRNELLAVPGVRRVESYRGLRVPFRDDEVLILTIEIAPMLERTHHDFLQGDTDSMREGLVHGRGCTVSDNFFRRFGLGKGDSVEIGTPGGIVRFPIVAVIRDYSSDRGSLFIDRALFVELWKDERVDTFDVSLEKSADPGKVRSAIRERLSGRLPALISTRREFTAEISRAIDAFYDLTKITVLLALVVAFLGIVTALLISVVERTREIGILKALGALGGQIRRSVVLEALVVAFVSLTLAIPFGLLDARFMETTVAEVFAGWRMANRFPVHVLLELAISLPIVSILAAWLPARSAARTVVTEAIEYE